MTATAATTTTLDIASLALGADAGETFDILGNRVTIKVTAEQTGGACALVEYLAQPGFGGPRPHRHLRTAELFYVLDGELTFTLAGREFVGGPGASVLIPRGVAHTFANRASRPARFLTLLSPGGFEDYFRRLAAAMPDPATPPAPEVMARLIADSDQVPA